MLDFETSQNLILRSRNCQIRGKLLLSWKLCYFRGAVSHWNNKILQPDVLYSYLKARKLVQQGCFFSLSQLWWPIAQIMFTGLLFYALMLGYTKWENWCLTKTNRVPSFLTQEGSVNFKTIQDSCLPISFTFNQIFRWKYMELLYVVISLSYCFNRLPLPILKQKTGKLCFVVRA